jgi:hypothetical protein
LGSKTQLPLKKLQLLEDESNSEVEGVGVEREMNEEIR